MRQHDGPKKPVAGRVTACGAYGCTAVEVGDAGRQVAMVDTHPVRNIDADQRQYCRYQRQSPDKHGSSITDKQVVAYIQDSVWFGRNRSLKMRAFLDAPIYGSLKGSVLGRPAC